MSKLLWTTVKGVKDVDGSTVYAYVDIKTAFMDSVTI